MILSVSLWALGCSKSAAPEAKVAAPAPAPAKREKPQPPPLPTSPVLDIDGTPAEVQRDENWAVRQVTAELKAAVADGPTLAVWIVDSSTSAVAMREQIAAQLSWLLPAVADADAESQDAPLTSLVVSFGKEAKFVQDEPTQSVTQLVEMLRKVEVDTSGQEMLFTAIELAMQRISTEGLARDRHPVLIVVTDEAGDDEAKVDELLPKFRKLPAPVLVIGAPAPFGHEAGLPPLAEASLDNAGQSAIRQGPESRHWERVYLASSIEISDADLADSGFGPFGLMRLVKESGGSMFLVREWSSSLAVTPRTEENAIDYDVMSRYEPDYVSEQAYQKLLESNGAMLALHRAAQSAKVNVLDVNMLEFRKTDEAELARRLGDAQRAAARVDQGLNQLYATLSEGQADRPKLTSPRWQAGYDLAMGRVAAAKARADGYNAMLAAMKRGKSFTNPDSNTWVLERAETVEGESGLERLARQSREHLTRVVQEHPGTPWAIVAQRELQIPVGWKWTEK